jgi:hypothetical protein
VDLATLMVIPTPLRLKTATNLPVPNDPALRGADLYFQMAVVPDLGFDAPPVLLPPGRRVVIRQAGRRGWVPRAWLSGP